jgi:magnesium protoporphyrin O-methyltransferase
MKTTPEKVKRYFDRIPNEWNSLYSDQNWILKNFNKYLRKGLFERYDLTFQHCGEIFGARVLDIGCGTGLYSIEFAKRGAAQVVGIDIAPAMINFSQQRAKELMVQDHCEFICDNFLNHTFKDNFDIIVALGVFDYIQDPGPYFNKISSLTKHRFLASFPKDSLFWGTQRKIRYCWIKKCPLYFYTFDRLIRLYKEANFAETNILPTTRGFFGFGIKY